FAPIKKAELIMVLHEHSHLYKLEEGVRYQIRDVAVMRGFIEKATVVLSSITPSIDSWFNALSGKYALITPDHDSGLPAISTVDMRFSNRIRPNLSKTVFEAARNSIRKDKKVMFVLNRKGYAALLLCRECGHTETCNTCNVPLVVYRQDRIMRCRYCGSTREIPDQCGRCRSHDLETVGTGTQRVQEDIEELLGATTLRFDSDQATRGSEVAELLRGITDDSSRVIIGTKMMTGRLKTGGLFALAAVLNADTAMNLPDFRAAEKAYMDLSAIRELVEPGGRVLIQTRFPQHPLFRYLKADDYPSFVREELAMRKSLSYPPYSKLLGITCSGSALLADRMIKTLTDLHHGLDILGPAISKDRKGREEISILLKSEDRKVLKKAAREIIKVYGEIKGIQISIDVDPA
ncbi:MAG: primosomal protein N', partial [Nitrospirae bacterium]|nr:primosomal protein N' [Nitrospirota bacterium]